jgi:hypothetical protein
VVDDTLADDLRALLESGSSTIVGFLNAAGEPFATRAWGTKVLPGAPLRLRTLVGAGALATAGRGPHLDEPFPIGVTGADVRSLQSVQAKGAVVALEPADDDDLLCSARYCDDFFHAVWEVDAVGRDLMERLVPTDLLACTVEVREFYDQTPGPGAGARLAR